MGEIRSIRNWNVLAVPCFKAIPEMEYVVKHAPTWKRFTWKHMTSMSSHINYVCTHAQTHRDFSVEQRCVCVCVHFTGKNYWDIILYIINFHFKMNNKDWRDDWEVKRTHCFCQRAGTQVPTPTAAGSQQPLFPDPRELVTLSGLRIHCTDTFIPVHGKHSHLYFEISL